MVQIPQKYGSLGRYLLLERLAAGGMGEVFLAKAGQQGFERYFAVKRIRSQLEGNESLVTMLMDEAKISLGLTHPNIAQVIEFGEESGNFFLVMEYVEGLSLSRLLSLGKKTDQLLSAADAVAVAIQLCRALGYAHGRLDAQGKRLNIVHRDVSPQNVLVDRSGLAKLIDFGIAKAMSTANATEAGMIKGKVSYMSPEQALGLPLDGRSDLFAVGVVLYECLSHRRLHGDGSFMERYQRVQAAELPDLDEVLGSKVPPSVIGVVRRALRASREERYRSAEEMERDLSRALQALEPEYTPHRLARMVTTLDADAEGRAERMRIYENFTPTETERPDAGQDQEIRQAPTKTYAVPSLTTPSGGDTLGGPTEVSLSGLISIAGEPAEVSLEPEPEPEPQRKKPYRAIGLVSVLALGLVAGLLAFLPREQAVSASSPPVDPAPEATGPAPTPVVAAATAQDPPTDLEPPSPSGSTGPGSATPPEEAAVAAASSERRSPSGKRARRAARRNAKPAPDPSPVAATGCVTVAASPWAYVDLDGKRIGQTPQRCIEASPGKHRLVLTNPALGVTRTHQVTVVSGGTVKIVERLEPAAGN